MAINRENFRKWVKALRSGQFKQGIEKLKRDDDRYCCLGVVCALMEREGLDPGWSPAFLDESGNSYLPIPAQRWLGVGGGNVTISEAIVATRANDTLRWSFERIADAIEAHYNLKGED